MQASEVIQIACAAVGIALLTKVRVSFASRYARDSGISAYSTSESCMRIASFALIGIALVLVFFPF
jgi:hypothetical protein